MSGSGQVPETLYVDKTGRAATSHVPAGLGRPMVVRQQIAGGEPICVADLDGFPKSRQVHVLQMIFQNLTTVNWYIGDDRINPSVEGNGLLLKAGSVTDPQQVALQWDPTSTYIAHDGTGEEDITVILVGDFEESDYQTGTST